MRRAFLLLLWLAESICAQQVHPVTGRHIAPVMGIGGADWLVRPEREAEESPDAALDAIGIARGAVVADIGAGAGYFTWRLAERVGPTGKVYANDIQPAMLELLRKIRESLKPDGRMVLLEYRKEDPNVPIRPEHKMSVDEVRAEVQPEGFRFEKNLPTLPRQHILIFHKSVQ